MQAEKSKNRSESLSPGQRKFSKNTSNQASKKRAGAWASAQTNSHGNKELRK